VKTNRIKPGRGVVLTLMIAACALLSCCAKKAPKVYRVGILSGLDSFAVIADGFRAKMTELGYTEGGNIVYDLQKINPDTVKERAVLNKFVTDKVDLIFVFPTGPVIEAKEITRGTDLPVVFASTVLEGSDLVESALRPGGNLTGVRSIGMDVLAPRLEFLLEIAPKTSRILMAYQSDYPPALAGLRLLRPLALARGVKLIEVPIKNLEDLRKNLAARTSSGKIGVDAVQMALDILTQSPEGWAIISGFAAEHNLPIVGATELQVRNGAILTYISDNFETGRMGAVLADKILKGAPPGTIPVVTPEGYLRVNYRTIQKLGLAAPEGLLSRAKEIIR